LVRGRIVLPSFTRRGLGEVEVPPLRRGQRGGLGEVGRWRAKRDGGVEAVISPLTRGNTRGYDNNI